MNVSGIPPGAPPPYRPVRPFQEPSPDDRLRGNRPQSVPREDVPGQASSPSTTPGAILTDDEGEFFERTYPENASEIRLRRSYTRSGESAGGTMGTLIDRKG